MQFGPMVSQVIPIIEESPVYSMARNASGTQLLSNFFNYISQVCESVIFVLDP